MRRPKIQISVSKCKRCGKSIASSQSSMNQELGEICSDCITPEEEMKILEIQGNMIRKGEM